MPAADFPEIMISCVPKLPMSIRALYRLPGLSFDENRPIISIYFDNPDHMQSRDLRADICVPVSARDEALSPRIAVAALAS
jgi:DNA gyrase inhibitor GyrI